jgi:hypothetical protein
VLTPILAHAKTDLTASRVSAALTVFIIRGERTIMLGSVGCLRSPTCAGGNVDTQRLRLSTLSTF